MRHLKPALVILALLSVLTGIVYPMFVTLVARTVFPKQASGSLLLKEGVVVGSTLIGQAFSEPGYFWSRLSATGPYPYNAGASSGSNRGPLNPELAAAAGARIEALMAADPGNAQRPVPVDLVTASASGLDPHLSPAAALYQVGRVARARDVDEARIRRLVEEHTEGRTFGLLGEPRVNVLELNLALDGMNQHDAMDDRP
jgi:K+-transporting ATPase ATPase C chain